jgi:hypothetical protein
MTNALVATIQQILPNAQIPRIYLYAAPNGSSAHGQNLMRTTTRGRGLFQYDPNGPGGNPEMRLYFETNQQI